MDRETNKILSVIVPTYNAEKFLQEVLESVKGFDEIVICDMESTDKTVEISESYGCKVVTFPKANHHSAEPARTFAIQSASCDWVLVIDADELVSKELKDSQYVCTACGHHLRLYVEKRFKLLFDDEKYTLVNLPSVQDDPLKFKDIQKYADRLKSNRKKTGCEDAIQVARGKIGKIDSVVAAMDFSFMGGSMGSVLGERFVRGVNLAIAERLPFISVAASGGARMQEGLFSLMQMAKTTAVLTKLSAAKLPYISVLTNPTMGGVSASFAFMGDIVLAEPGALVGFAGPRVIEQTVRQTLP